MEVAAIRALVEQARVGYLGTVGRDGSPHVVPVCFALIEGSVYSAVDHKPKRRTRLQRIANIEATGRACLLVDEYDDHDWSRLWWVRLDGPARVVTDIAEQSKASAQLASKYEQYRKVHPAGPVLAVDIARWSGWRADSLT